MGTSIVVTILAIIVGLIIFGMVRDKKAGKSSCSCGCGCSSCPMSGKCHQKK